MNALNLIMNLNGALLCPFQGVLDLAAQLTDSIDEFNRRTFQPVYELNSINDWVNVDDSLGDLSATRAKEFSDMLCALLINSRVIKLHIYLDDTPLTIDNFYILFYLAESLDKLYIVFYISPKIKSDKYRFIDNLKEQGRISIDYKSSKCFINENYLVVQSEKLSIKRSQILYEMGFIFELCVDGSINGLRSNLSILITYAWMCLKAGAYSLGCSIFETLLSNNNLDSLVREELFVHLQIIRFLSHQHYLLLTEYFPEVFNFINQYRIKHLYFIKAFSATLTRNLLVADLCFQKAGIIETMPIIDENSAYKLNLYALFLLLKGDSNAALQLEMKIQRYIKIHHANAIALHHVVFMNIARLYKKLKCYKLSADYYQKAYAQISGGGFTLFDHMSYAMDHAILDEARGWARKALYGWIKVAIYWISCPNPYALAMRPRLVLCQESAADTLVPLSRKKVTQFLLKKISSLCTLINVNHGNAHYPVFNFVLDDAKNIQKNVCHIINGLVIYSCTSVLKQAQFENGSLGHDLCGLVSGILINTINMVNDSSQIFVIETNHDNFYTQTQEKSLVLALLSRCSLCWYNQEGIALDQALPVKLLANTKLMLSQLIYAIEPDLNGINLVYKRSFLNKNIRSAAEIKLVMKFYNNTERISFKECCPDLLRSLFAKKVIVLDFS